MEREEFVVDVIAKIRFPLMSKEEMLACYHPPILPGIVKIPEVKTTLLNATCYVVAKSLGQENLFTELAAEPRTFLFEGEPMVLWDLCLFEPDKFEQNRRNQATVKIQAIVRGYLTRKQLRANIDIAHCAAAVIQAAFRGYSARKKLNILLDKPKEVIKETSVLPIRSGVPRKKKIPLTPLYMMGAFKCSGLSQGSNVIFNYDVESEKWSDLTKCPVPRHGAKMIATNRALYVIGGCNPLDHKYCEKLIPLRECYKYQFENEEWKLIAPMNHARVFHAAVVFKGMILVLGGKDEKDRLLSSIERYDVLHNSWQNFTSTLPEPRMAMGVAVNDDNLWIAGGIINKDRFCIVDDSVWCFDNACWLKRCKLPQPLAFCTLLADRKRILCLGGVSPAQPGEDHSLESLNKVYVMEDSKEGGWTEDVPMPLECHNIVASSLDGNIYVFGGFRTQTLDQMVNTVYFDKEKRVWEPLCDLPKKAAGFVVDICGNV